METERDRLAAGNESVKLLAGFVNAIALGLIGFAVLRPLTEIPMSISFAAFWWGTIGLALHGFSHYILRQMRRRIDE